MAKNTHVSVTQTIPALKMQPDQDLSLKECTLETLPETEEEVLRYLRQYPLLYGSYQSLNPGWRQHFMDFCRGKKSLPLTYDPFFKRIFHPDIHPDRLSRLVSSILGMTVRVVRILPSEDSMIDGGTLLIMDLLGELEDGSLINVEIQKQGYAFPAERISCYSSDLVMRQYARVKGIKGRNFTYQDIKKVYVIVLFEKSPGEFHKIPCAYVHHGRTRFDTGLEMGLLQEYFLIALDVFRKFPYPKNISEQTAWLSLLVTEDLKEAEKLIRDYPWLQEIYEEIAMLRRKPEEVLGMFSEALRILDQNTIKYMIEMQQKELEEKAAQLEEKDAQLRNKDATINEKDTIISEKEAAITEKDTIISEKNTAINQSNTVIEAQKEEIADLKKQLEEQLKALEALKEKS